MTERHPPDGTGYRHPAAVRRTPPATLALALAAVPPALLYAVGHPAQTVAALAAFAVLVVTRGRPET